MELVNEGKLTKLVHHYEENQFKYSELWLDNVPIKGEDFYAKVPVEFLGKKVFYIRMEKDGNGNEAQSLRCKIRRKGYLVVNAEVPRGMPIEQNTV